MPLLRVHRRVAAAALTSALLACWSPARAAGQSLSGMVAEQLSLAPVRGAVVTLFRVGGEDGLEPVGLTTTDSDGAFSFRTPGPGVYRVQADLNGLSTPLSAPLELTRPDARTDVALLLPSALLRMALACQDGATAKTAAVVGVVRDSGSGVALPGTTVAATWREGRVVRRVEAEADGAGRYRMCLPAGVGEVELQTLVLGKWLGHDGVDVAGPSVLIADLDVPVAFPPEAPFGALQGATLTDAASEGISDLRGELLDGASGAPLPYAVVRLRSTAFQTAADESGGFAFVGLPPGSYTLEIRSLGYAVTSQAVEVPPGKNVFVDLRVAPQAVELEGLVVTARPVAERVVRVTPFRRNVVAGEKMAQEERRGALAFEALRRSAPGLRVTETYRDGGPPILCVESARGRDTFQRPGCNSVQVVVDGVRIPDGADFLHHTPASEIESIEYVSPMQAQILYGIGGDTANGIVVVFTRGKGPYASKKRGGGPGSAEPRPRGS
jgi:hypothetical protein